VSRQCGLRGARRPERNAKHNQVRSLQPLDEHAYGNSFGPEQRNSTAYLFGLSDGSVIDGAEGGNATRHINHACVPNVEAVERRGANDELLIVVRTIRTIQAGDELFLDYALAIDGDDPSDYPCACGTDACRGTMAALAAISASAL
jgi:SET domain-containing protein